MRGRHLPRRFRGRSTPSAVGWAFPVAEMLEPRLLLDALPAGAMPPTFVDAQAGLPGLRFASAAWGDYDNDGDLDLAATGLDSLLTPRSMVLRNDQGTFHDAGAALHEAEHGDLGWADFDNDGDLDLALSGHGWAGPYGTVYRNGPPIGSLVDTGGVLTGVADASLAWGDYDRDGLMDLVVTGDRFAGGPTPTSTLYHNTGAGLVPVEAALVGVSDSSAAWGDYDNDGDLDLLLTGQGAGFVPVTRLYRNDPGGFVDSGAGLPGVCGGSAAWGDYDRDGDMDLALTGGIYGGRIARVYRNDGGVLSDSGAVLPGVINSSVAWGDCDNDGDLDLAITGIGPDDPYITMICLNDGGAFAARDVGIPGLAWGSVGWGDYDNDGDMDLVLTGLNNAGGPATAIYRNQLIQRADWAPNSQPYVPYGLSTSVAGDDVTFRWQGGDDNETPHDGLTFNLRVGTTPGGDDVVAASSDPATGRRRLPDMGNVQDNLSWTIRDLAPGTYFWSVQTVDSGLAASSWAAGQSVVVAAPPPGEIRGVVWSDLDGDGQRDAGEGGLADWTVYVDQDNDGLWDGWGFDPNGYPVGTVLNTARPEVALTALGTTSGKVYSAADPVHPAEPQHTFGHNPDFLWTDSVRLKAMFAQPVSSVRIEFMSIADTSSGRLEAYNAAGVLLASYDTAGLYKSQSEQMTVIRPAADIAYVIAGGRSGSQGLLDKLAFGEPSAATGTGGAYTITGLSAGTYTVGEVPQSGWLQTFPGTVSGEPGDLIDNGSFERKDFSSWVAGTTGGPPAPWAVRDPTTGGLNPCPPLDGTYDAMNPFDGQAQTAYTLHQDVEIPADGAALLRWSSRFQWSFGPPATLPRTCDVQVLNPTTGATLATVYSFSTGTYTTNPTGNTGWQSHEADLSAFAGQTVRLAFRESIPQTMTGPGQAEFDAIQLLWRPLSGVHRVTLAPGQSVPGVDFANVAVPPTLGALDMWDQTDTGDRKDDNLTYLNNGSAGGALDFWVAGISAGATVTLYADGVPIGQVAGAAGATAVHTDGQTVLSDGPHTLTARQRVGQGHESLDSPPLVVTIDTVRPRAELVLQGGGVLPAGTQILTIRFTEPVAGIGTASLQEASLGQLGSRDLSLAGDGRSGSWSYGPGLPPAAAPHTYELSVLVGLRDAAGNKVDGDGLGGGEYRVNFSVAQVGDADIDGEVSSLDYLAMKSAFGLAAGVGWGHGDFNGDGKVDRLDMLAIESNFGWARAMPPASPLAATEPAPAPVPAPAGQAPPRRAARQTMLALASAVGEPSAGVGRAAVAPVAWLASSDRPGGQDASAARGQRVGCLSLDLLTIPPLGVLLPRRA